MGFHPVCIACRTDYSDFMSRFNRVVFFESLGIWVIFFYIQMHICNLDDFIIG